MTLLLRVIAGNDRTHDLRVDTDPGHTVRDVTSAVCERLSLSSGTATLTPDRTGVTLDPDTLIADADLLSGDAVRVGPISSLAPVPRSPRRAVTADVLAGPESGRSELLPAGRFTIGRSAGCDLSIDDASVSRRHVELEVAADWTVTVNPLADTANGVTVNDVEITGPTPVGDDDVVGLGGTRLAFRAFERSHDEHVDRLGQIEFHRTPYRPPVVSERDADPIGPIPERPEPRRFQVFAAIAPLGAGLAMYAFTRQPQFLILTLISPIVMIATVIEDRRTGRHRFRDQLRDFRLGLPGHRTRYEELRHRERIERLHAAPDLADLVRRAELRTIDLWPRGRDSPDFLRLRLGLGASEVGFPIELDRGGDADLRAEALDAVDGVDTIDNVPITVDVIADPVVGVHGETPLVDGVVASLIVQAATLHSPEDLTIVTAIAPHRPFDWLKWLPHTRSVASPLPGPHLVSTEDDANGLISRVLEVAAFRQAESRPGSTDAERRCWPRILLFIDDDLAADPAEVSRLLDVAPDTGVGVVWLAASAAGVPRHASRILDVRRADGAAMVGRLWSTDPTQPDHTLEVEHLRSGLADRAARALAPVRDASTASLATSIPRTAPLLDVLGVGRPSAQWVSEQWLAGGGYELTFPIGVGADGNVDLDLVADGPHTLIGGTSGAGKSELLQSMVAALAVRHPPSRLNFLFVDYKGGASSQVFERLPHTVGYVTNLSAELSLRALTSLRAELNRRMSLMEGRAKDLADMLEVAPDDAPASLVIVVDEFATLVKEVPEFVAGVIDIAQRGRSLGIHLVLATQRPSGSVNENILANTNLRMSLRMLDRSESSAIIDSPAAADIPVPLRGRGLVRLGPRRLVEFQSAYASAPLVSESERPPVVVNSFGADDAELAPRPAETASGGGSDSTTHLAVVIDAVAKASDELALPAPRQPWREVLPDTVPLDRVLSDTGLQLASEHPGRHVVIGLLDAPEQQEQRPALVDLEEGGGLLVFGTGGSGKTTLLRTVAASISAVSSGDDVAMLALDFASRGLAGLDALPEMIDVATGDDTEAITRHLTMLDTELERRRRLLADAGAEHLTAYVRDHDRLPRIVVLIDGFGGLASTFADGGGSIGGASMEIWSERVMRLVIEGRQVGIHTVITADRRNAVPSRIHSAVANRMILRHADETSYAEHGINSERARRLDLIPGRGLLQATTLVQVASVSDDPGARAQNEQLAALAQRLGRPPTPVLQSRPLPDRVELDGPTDDRPLHVALGVSDVTDERVVVDLEWSNLTVCGPPRSGRSSTLLTVARGLSTNHDVFAVGPTSSRLRELDGDNAVVGKPDELLPLLDRLANLSEMGPGARPRVLVIDDVDALDDPTLTAVWDRLVGSDDLRVVAAAESRSMTGYTASPMMNAIRRARRLLVLQPDEPSEFLQLTGIKLPTRPGLRLPPGRGVLLVDRIPQVIQVAV